MSISLPIYLEGPFCTYYMEMGVDEADVRKISGHKSKEMLMNYVREARPDFSEWEKYM